MPGRPAASANVHPHAQALLDAEAKRLVEPADRGIGRSYLEVDLGAARHAQRFDRMAHEGRADASTAILRGETATV